MSKGKFFLVVFFIFLVTIPFGVGLTQDILKLKDLSNYKIELLSDDDLIKFKQQLQQRGLTESEAEQLALQRGLPTVELSKLRARLASMNKSFGRNNSIASKVISELNDSVPSPNYGQNQETEVRNKVFGSEIFSNPSIIFEPNNRLPTPKNYILGTDDELLIDIFGFQEVNHKLVVSPEGTINIPMIGNIVIVGLTIEQASKRIKEKMERNGYSSLRDNTSQIIISVGRVRSIRITVIGEAKHPGSYTLSSLSTLFNALYLAGGPNEKGSMRQIELFRNNKLHLKLDAYDFLLKGDLSKNIRILDQDVIRIPPAELTVTLNGGVKHTGIFEMLPSENLKTLLEFCGGFSNEAYTASVQVKQVTETERAIKDISKIDFEKYFPRSGDTITVGKILNRYKNKVNISGGVNRPGQYELTKGLGLSDLIKRAEGLKEDAYMDRGVVIRVDDSDLTKRIIPFSVIELLNKNKNDLLLQKNDEILIGQAMDYKEKYLVTLEGEVRKPGIFPFFKGMTLTDLIFLADGFTDASELGNIEIARRVEGDGDSKKNQTAIIIETNANRDLRLRTSEIVLHPWDVVSIRKKKDYKEQLSVRVEGEVKFPGNYILSEKNERVSSLLKRAGGITDEAFVEAASLIRVNKSMLKEGKISEDKVRKIQKQLKDTSSTLVESYTNPTIKVGLDLFKILVSPRGLEDILLQEGDILNIPKQHSEVKVNGEVMVPSEVVFKKGENLKYYIDKAGGFTDDAREKRVYVLYPNGDADRVKRILFFKRYPQITPGSEILVPKIPEHKRNVLTTAEIIGLTSALASMAGVVIAILRR